MKTEFVTLKNYVFFLKGLVSGAIKCSYQIQFLALILISLQSGLVFP